MRIRPRTLWQTRLRRAREGDRDQAFGGGVPADPPRGNVACSAPRSVGQRGRAHQWRAPAEFSLGWMPQMFGMLRACEGESLSRRGGAGAQRGGRWAAQGSTRRAQCGARQRRRTHAGECCGQAPLWAHTRPVVVCASAPGRRGMRATRLQTRGEREFAGQHGLREFYKRSLHNLAQHREKVRQALRPVSHDKRPFDRGECGDYMIRT